MDVKNFYSYIIKVVIRKNTCNMYTRRNKEFQFDAHLIRSIIFHTCVFKCIFFIFSFIIT